MTDGPVPQFDVHLFPVIRLKITGISASDPVEAIRIAQERLPYDQLETQIRALDAEYADEISHYLVDVVGDEDFEHSQYFHSSLEPCLEPLRKLVAWFDGGRDESVLNPLIADVREMLKKTV